MNAGMPKHIGGSEHPGVGTCARLLGVLCQGILAEWYSPPQHGAAGSGTLGRELAVQRFGPAAQVDQPQSPLRGLGCPTDAATVEEGSLAGSDNDYAVVIARVRRLATDVDRAEASEAIEVSLSRPERDAIGRGKTLGRDIPRRLVRGRSSAPWPAVPSDGGRRVVVLPARRPHARVVGADRRPGDRASRRHLCFVDCASEPPSIPMLNRPGFRDCSLLWATASQAA